MAFLSLKDITAVQRAVFVMKGGVAAKRGARRGCTVLNSSENGTILRWRGHRGMGSTMPNDSHQRAAEFHELAAHAHRAAAAHHGKEDHQTGHEHSKQAMEYANKAFQWSQEAHGKSVKSAGKS